MLFVVTTLTTLYRTNEVLMVLPCSMGWRWAMTPFHSLSFFKFVVIINNMPFLSVHLKWEIKIDLTF